MGGKKTVRGVYLTEEQCEAIERLAVEMYGSIEGFGDAAGLEGKKMSSFSYWVLPRQIPRYLKGKAVNPRPARAMFSALGRNSKVSFLEEIGSQLLAGERRDEVDSGQRRSLSYEEFTKLKSGNEVE